MIDNRRFSRGATVDEQALRAVTVRRLKTDIKDKAFKPRQIKTIPFTPTDDEVQAFDQLVQILDRSAQANGRRRANDIVALLLKKRFLSSPWAFAQTLARYEQARETGVQLEITDDYYAEVIGSEQSDEGEGGVDHPEFDALRQTKATDPLAASDTRDIGRLVAWGDGYEHKPDSRLRALLTTLDAVCRPDGRTWSNERVVIFTERGRAPDPGSAGR